MRFLIASVLLCSLVALSAGFMSEEMMEMKKWAFMKAIESCVGESAFKMHMIKIKKASAKCSGQDAPELEIPMFSRPYEVVNFLNDDSEFEDQDADGGFGRLMEKYLQVQMMKEFSSTSNNRARRFNKRDTEDDPFSLGERLHKKLAMKKKEMEAKIGNMTCMAKECNMLTDDDDLDVNGIKNFFKEIEFPSAWLKEKLQQGCDGCIQFVKAIPDKLFEDCNYGVGLGKVKAFKMCMMKAKINVCMQNDIRNKLEKNFGPVDELVKKTGLKEKDLYAVVKQMLSGAGKGMM